MLEYCIAGCSTAHCIKKFMELIMDFFKKKNRPDLKSRPREFRNNCKKDKIIEIFKPGKKVDVVFFLKSALPEVRNTIIHDCDHDNKNIIISQTNPVINYSTEYEKMGLTTLLSNNRRLKKRIGVYCRTIKILKDYSINDQMKENAVSINYSRPIKEFNIREAFRFEPPADLQVKGRIAHGEAVLHSKKDFMVHNISLGGIGLIVNKTKEAVWKLFSRIRLNENIKAEFNLIDFESLEYQATVSAISSIVWKKETFTEKYGYIGAKFKKLGVKDELMLNRFIHNGQLLTIRKNQVLA